jgi:site-specific DNA-methyltransferase (adenine-specific)
MYYDDASASVKGRAGANLRERLREQAVLSLDTMADAGRGKNVSLSEFSYYFLSEALEWMESIPENSVHAIVTDPPYGVIEYDAVNQEKMRNGRGGVWRIPPSYDGVKRAPLPRFTVLTEAHLAALDAFFASFAERALRILAPGGHLIIASNPLVSTATFFSIQKSGFEKRGEIIRLVQTLRGGDRPKGAEKEFSEVSVMARSCWEPWGIFRKPFKGTVSENLRRWGTGGLRRPSEEEPFKDVIPCWPSRGLEREIAPHPSLKPQRFLRRVVRASLPLGVGVVYDPFAGSGSTLAAAEANGYLSIGTERDTEFFDMACRSFGQLVKIKDPDSL